MIPIVGINKCLSILGLGTMRFIPEFLGSDMCSSHTISNKSHK